MYENYSGLTNRRPYFYNHSRSSLWESGVVCCLCCVCNGCRLDPHTCTIITFSSVFYRLWSYQKISPLAANSPRPFVLFVMVSCLTTEEVGTNSYDGWITITASKRFSMWRTANPCWFSSRLEDRNRITFEMWVIIIQPRLLFLINLCTKTQQREYKQKMLMTKMRLRLLSGLDVEWVDIHRTRLSFLFNIYTQNYHPNHKCITMMMTNFMKHKLYLLTIPYERTFFNRVCDSCSNLRSNSSTRP